MKDIQSPIFSLVKGNVQAKKGLDEISITALDKDWGQLKLIRNPLLYVLVLENITHLIQRCVSVSVSLDSLSLSQSLLESSTEG